MSSSKYLQKQVAKKYAETIGEASREAGDAILDAIDSGADSRLLKDKAIDEFRAKRTEARKKKKQDKALISSHGKRAAKARGFGTNYNAKPYANAVRKPKANLK